MREVLLHATFLERGLTAGNFQRGDWLERSRRGLSFLTATPAWTPKSPVAVDVYWGEWPVDLAALNPFLCVFRASAQYADRSRAEDSRAVDYSNQCKASGIKRGMYHFLRPGGIAEQAALFNSVWDKCGGAELRPVVDVEINVDAIGYSRSEWTSNIKTFIDLVEAHTGKSPIIYTSMYFWDFTTHPAWAANYDLWAAWYPYTPDDYASLPANRTPAGFKRLAMWQYAEDGRSQGYLANDYNKVEDWLVAELGGETPQVNVEYFHNKKIEVTHGRYDNGGKPFDYHIIKFARADIKRTFTTPGPITGKALTEDFLIGNGLHVAANMDEVITGTLTPKGWGLSGGKLYKNSTSETGVWFKDHQPFAMQWARPLAGETDAACGSNILVKDGEVWPNLDNTAADPRTILAYNDKFCFFFMVDGRLLPGEPGVTRFDIANFIKFYGDKYSMDGLMNAHNLDGGGSSRAAVLNDSGQVQLSNRPCEKRPVINHVGFELTGGIAPVEEPKRMEQYFYDKLKKVWIESMEKPSPLQLLGSDGTRYIPKYWYNKKYYRVLRDQETDKYTNYPDHVRSAAPAPAVWRVGGNAYQMGRSLQFFQADLLALSKYGRKFADLTLEERSYIASKFTSLYRSDRAFTNRTGFPALPNGDLTARKNYIKVDPNDIDEEPRFDLIRVCSDDVVSGHEDGTDLVLDHFITVPKVYDITILNDPRVFRATIINRDGTLQEFPQLDGAPVYVPLMSKYELRIPLKYVERVTI